MRATSSWNTSIESYSLKLWSDDSEELRQARAASEKFEKTQISLSSVEARMLSFLIAQNRCQKFIEIGTLTGYSALWILRALPEDGKLWTFEIDADYAKAAREVLKADSRAKVVEGDALICLQTVAAEGPFDGIFIDGNKAAYGQYLDWAEKNLRSGGLILADNVFLGGSVIGENGWGSPKQTQVMNEVNQRLSNPNNYRSCLIPTGEGLLVAVKN